MAINLQKGQTIDLRKNAKGESVYDLSQITVGLGWDVREEKKGFLGNCLVVVIKKILTWMLLHFFRFKWICCKPWEGFDIFER
jgi:stress response protein SCP2